MSSVMREDWIEVLSGEILDIRDGTHDTPKYISEQTYPLVTSKNLKNGVIDFSNIKYISEQDFTEINKRSKVDIGDILFAMIGTIGNPVLVKTEPHYSIKNIGLFKNPLKIIKSELVKYYLDSLNFYSQLEERQFLKGTTQKFIPLGHLRNIHFPLAPLPIQRAIVSKIEALFSDLDNGIANFKKAQEQLKIYRQAVLKKAFEGKLSELGKVGLKDDRIIDVEKDEKTEILQSNNPKNPNSDNEEDNLPKGWKWVKLKDISEFITDGDHQAPPKADEGIPFITISNVNKNTNKINFDNTFKVKSEYYFGIKDHRKPKIGDILYTVTGSFGIPIIIDFEKEFCFQRHIGLIRPLSSVNQKYLYYLLQTNAVFNQASETATGTAQKTVALSSLRNFTIPFCSSTQEQTQIVQEIESRLSVCDKMEQSITESIEKAEALRQSILKKAFEGKLLSQAEIAQCKQAADYEPASELLKKIQAEKAAILQQAQDAKKKKPSVKKK
jgi:type I restriction enzyme S subunit